MARRNSKSLLPYIWLMTPQHTGTHFVRCLLESHPQISYWLQGNHALTTGLLTNASHGYYRGWLSLFEFKKALAILKPCHVTWTNNQLRQNKIPIEPKTEIRYGVFHSHAGELLENDLSFWQGRGCVAGFKVIVTVRDPLFSIITALRRTNLGARQARVLVKVMKGIMSADWFKDVFVFKTDLWAGTQRGMEVFDFLGLERHPACSKYLEMCPRINETTEAIENRSVTDNEPLATSERMEELRLAKTMLQKGELHPTLREWCSFLQEMKMQPYFEKLGYENLLWYV